MNLGISDLSFFSENYRKTVQSSDSGDFKAMVENAVAERRSDLSRIYSHNSAFVAISPKFEKKLPEDPELAEEITQKINEMCRDHGENYKHNVIIIDRNGEISQHSTKPEKDSRPTAEELKEVAKARARKKARLDKYFHLLERVAIKRKLLEQENAKRARNKKYRFSVTKLNCIADSYQITTPPNPDFYF